MILSNRQNAVAFTDSPAIPAATSTTLKPLAPPIQPAASQPEVIRHMLFGPLLAVQATIVHLHKLRYAEANDWSQPISTGRPNEVMAILTKKVRI